MSDNFAHDFNGADAQQNAFELIPAGTLAKVRLTIRPGGAGPEGWTTQSRTSEAQYLNTEAMILDGGLAKRRVFTRIGVRGKGGQGADDNYGNRGRALLRGILESARGIGAKDTSDRARAARTIRGYGDLNGLEFIARIGIDKDRNDPTDGGRNVVAAAVGPEHADYARLMGSAPTPLPVTVSNTVNNAAGAAPSWASPPGNANAPSWAR